MPNLANTHPGLILLMVAGFLLWWPLGLLALAFILWSGSFGRTNGQWWERIKSFGGSWFTSTGNKAFDQHRKDTLRKLEEEAKAFQEFVDKMRFTKDADEFDKFMRDRNMRNTHSEAPNA